MTATTHTYTAIVKRPGRLRDAFLTVKGGRVTLDSEDAPHVHAEIVVPVPQHWAPITPSGGGHWEDTGAEQFPFFGTGGPPFQISAPDRVWIDEPIRWDNEPVEDEDPPPPVDDDGVPFFGTGGPPFYISPYVPEEPVELPPVPADLRDIDPRNPPRIHITAVRTGQDDQTRIFNLTLRARRVSQGNGTITLILASDEALLSDFAPLTDDDAPTALAESLRAVVNYVIGVVLPGTELAPDLFDVDLTATDIDDDALIWKAGVSGLAFLAPLVQAHGLRLVCDEAREWTLRTEEYVTPGSITVEYAVNLIDGEDTLSRDDDTWFDAATTRYTWTDSGGVARERIDAFALTTPHTKVALFEKSTPYPGAGFSEYAVRRAQGRARDVTATCVADWDAAAEMPTTAILAGVRPQTGVSRSVEYDLDTDRMTVTTRTNDPIEEE